MKPDIGGEAMGRSSRRISRGERGDARRDRSAEGLLRFSAWDARKGSDFERRSNRQREQITASGPCRELVRPIVARKSGNADRAKGPCWKQAESKRKGEPPKQRPKFRFYVLYDRIYRWDALEEAWRRVRANFFALAPGRTGRGRRFDRPD